MVDGVSILSLADLEKFANSELEEAAFFDKEWKAFGVALPWMPERIWIADAAPLVAVSLCILIFYFWLFARHARFTGAAASCGTLFGALNVDIWSRILFTLVALFPGVALVLLFRADTSSKLIFGCAVFVLLLSIDAVRHCLQSRMSR